MSQQNVLTFFQTRTIDPPVLMHNVASPCTFTITRPQLRQNKENLERTFRLF